MAWVVGLIIPIALAPKPYSVNQMLPSGPAVIPSGLAIGYGNGESELTACVVGLITPIALVPDSVNQRLPSGPDVIPPHRSQDAGDAEFGDGGNPRQQATLFQPFELEPCPGPAGAAMRFGSALRGRLGPPGDPGKRESGPEP